MEPRQSRATEPAGPDAPAAGTRALRGPRAARALESTSAWFNALPAWARWVLIGALLAGAWAAVWASGGTARAMPHLFYIPILTGAYFFRWPGALVTGVLASILCGPLLPLLVEPYTPQTTQSWVLRSAFFLGIGALAAAALAAQSRAEEREITQDLLSQLQFEVRGPVDTALVPLVAEVLESRAFHTVMQPVYSLHDGRLMGVEALTRFDRGPARPPDRWFAAADSLGLGTDLERAAIAGALKAGAALPSRVVLSVNASPATLADPRLIDLLRTRRHTAVTVEITEHAVVEDYPLLRDVVDQVRELGVRIAVDDAGAGVAAVGLTLEVQQVAERLLIDHHLVHRHVLAVDLGGRQVELRLGVTAGGALQQLGPGDDGAAHGGVGNGQPRIGEGGLQRFGPHTGRTQDGVLNFMQVIEHRTFSPFPRHLIDSFVTH